MKNSLTTADMETLKKVALGLDKADIGLLNGDIVDVYSGTMLKQYSVAIKGNWIASVNQNIDQCIGANTQVIDVTGKILVPGFIEGHTHLNYIASPEEFLRHSMAGGTTTIITESSEISYTAGLKGIIEFIEAFQEQPIKVYATVPPPLNLSKSGNELLPSVHQYKKLLYREDVVGVGEAYWQMVLNGNKFLPELAQEALRLGKTVEGHSAGAHNDKLTAYIAHGITSCHESVSVEDVLERLRMGLFVMIREGTIRQELDSMVMLRDMKIDFSRLSLVTDGLDPRDLQKRGFLEAVVQKAINLGFDFIRTIQMVSINPATHFRLDNFIGGIAPCKHADILVLPNTSTILPEIVLSRGQIIARNGNLLIQPRKTTFTVKGLSKLNRHIRVSDLKIKAPGSTYKKVRVIDMVTDLVSREHLEELAPINGEIKTDTNRDILKITFVGLNHKIVNAFIRGSGLKSGAIASSYIWETYGVIAIGTNERDMVTAINRIIDYGGGIVVSNNEAIQAELALPIAGIMAKLPMESIVEKLNQIQQKAEDFGCKFPDVFKSISVLSTGAIPFLRITEEGVLDLKTNKIVSLFY